MIEADPDIAGIGVGGSCFPLYRESLTALQVRLAAYIQSVCSVILLGLSSESSNALRGTLVLTSLALVGSIAVFSLKAELSLHHAMVSVSLLTVSMLPLHFVESWRVTSPSLFIAQQLRLGIYTALQLWLVFKTACLGSHPECNLCTRTVMFFKAYPAVSDCGRSIRVFVILFVGANWILGVYTYGPSHYVEALPAMLSNRRAARWEPSPSTPLTT